MAPVIYVRSRSGGPRGAMICLFSHLCGRRCPDCREPCVAELDTGHPRTSHFTHEGHLFA